jgi:hypothetical protein
LPPITTHHNITNIYPLKTHYLQPTTSIRRKFQRIWDQPLGLGKKKWNRSCRVLKTELHYQATIVCGDSHTSTHGAFGAIVGTWGRNGPFYVSCNQNQRCLFTSLVIFIRSYTKRRCIIYHLKLSTQALLVILWIRRKSFEDMTMEGRMTVCNLVSNALVEEWLPQIKRLWLFRRTSYAPAGCFGIQP